MSWYSAVNRIAQWSLSVHALKYGETWFSELLFVCSGAFLVTAQVPLEMGLLPCLTDSTPTPPFPLPYLARYCKRSLCLTRPGLVSGSEAWSAASPAYFLERSSCQRCVSASSGPLLLQLPRLPFRGTVLPSMTLAGLHISSSCVESRRLAFLNALKLDKAGTLLASYHRVGSMHRAIGEGSRSPKV